MLLFEDIRKRQQRTYVRFDDLPIMMLINNRILENHLSTIKDVSIKLPILSIIGTYVPVYLQQNVFSLIQSFLDLNYEHMSFVGKFKYKYYPDKIPSFSIRVRHEMISHMAIIGKTKNKVVNEFYDGNVYFNKVNNFSDLSVLVIKIK